MAILLDTSYLLAISWTRDKNHALAIRAAQIFTNETLIVPAPMLTELFYMLYTRANYRTALNVFNFLRTEPKYHIETLTDGDMARMAQIMDQYFDAVFDYVDTALMSLSERLLITEVFTFDRRDFSIFRPAHAAALNLIP